MRKVIIFDYDGTIVDSTQTVKSAFNNIAEKYSLKKTISNEDFGKLYDTNMYDELINRGLDANKIKEFILEWRTPLLKANNKIKIFKGVKEIIEKLSINNELYVVTSNASDVIISSIEHLGIKGIKEVLGGDKEKSKVVKIETIKRKYPNSEVYYIGDTTGDVLEAKQAKVKSIAITWGLHSRDKLLKAKPDFIVDKPEDILEIFG